MSSIARTVASAALVALGLLAVPSPVSAHTDSDLVAVPARGEATVAFQPTHGCDGSPTVEVSVRAPVEGATAGPVEGWTGSAEPEGDGNTVLSWTGGVLPATETGSFPVTFTAPDSPGELLTFPAVQMCENGEELAWISGDPDGEYPAPRLLVLPADAAPAATIDEVPADAPGRDQLSSIVDVDNPGAADPDGDDPDASSPVTPSTEEPTEATRPADDEDDAAGTAVPLTAEDPDDGGSSSTLVAVVVAVVLAGAGGAYLLFRRRPTT